MVVDAPNQYKRIEESDWGSFGGNHKKYRKFMNDLTQTIDTNMPGHLRDSLLEYGVLLPMDSQACVEITLDTSILFKQIMGELKGYRSSLVDMVQKEFLILYAPPKLEFEITEKIKKKIPENKQKLALSSAKRILEFVRIVDDIDHRVDTLAEELLGKRDPEDVVFLAVTFQKHAHGILTADRDFENITNIKIWQVGTLGKIVTGLRQGSVVIWLVTKGLPAAFILLGVTVALIVKSIIGIGKILYGAGKHLFSYVMEKAKQIPPIIPLVIMIFGFLALGLSKELRNTAQQGLEEIIKWVNDVGLRVADTLQQFGELVRTTLLNLVGEFPTLVEVIGFLAYDIFSMVDQLRTLESERAQLPAPSPYEILMDDLDRILESLKMEDKKTTTNNRDEVSPKGGESVTLTLRDIYSRQIAIINVGMSTAYGIPGPLFKGGTFRFIPIPESYPSIRTPTYADLGLRKWVTDPEVYVHYDPEFDTMTYGDYRYKEDGTRNIRVSNALKLQPKDFLFFFASLANKKYRRLGRTLGMFLIGFFEIRRVFACDEAKLSTLTKKNAHRKRKNDSNYTIWKGTKNSTLFMYAVPMSKGNVNSYLRTSRGDHLPWGSKNKNGRTLTDLEVINSATRASRLIKLEFRKLFWNYIIEKNPNLSSLQ